MSTPKEAFLIKYGPDHHRDSLIDAAVENKKPPAKLGSPLLDRDRQMKLLHNFGHAIAPTIVRNNPNPAPEIVDIHIDSDVDYIHTHLSRTRQGSVTTEQLKRAIDHESPDTYDTDRYVASGTMTPDVAAHMMRRWPSKTSHIVDAVRRANKEDEFIPHIIDNAHHSYDIADAIRGRHGNYEIPDHIIDKLMNSKNPEAHKAAGVFGSSLKAHHLDKMIDHGQYGPVISSKVKTKEHLERIANEAKDNDFGKLAKSILDNRHSSK